VEFEGSTGPGGDSEVEGLESTVFEVSEDPLGGESALQGLESSEFEVPAASDTPSEVEGLQPPGDNLAESDLTLDRGEDLVLNAAQENEFQAANDAEALNLEAAEETEYQESDAADEVVLRPSGDFEYQAPHDPDVLDGESSEDESQDLDTGGTAGVEDELGEEVQDESLSPRSSDQSDSPWTTATPEHESPGATDEPGEEPVERVEPEQVSSWFAPAEEEAVSTPMSQPDGTTESLESDEPQETPAFEEQEPLPSAWSPAPAADDPLSPAASEQPESVLESESEEPPTPPSGDTEIDDVADAERTVWGSTVFAAAEEAVESASEPVTPEADTEYETSEPDIVATETMAELYMSQGHRNEALEVYRILLDETPDDHRLKEKVEALESELEGVAAAEESSDAAADSAWDEVTVSEDAEPAPNYAASKTGGQPARAFFKDLLASRPTAAAPPEAASIEDSEEPARDVVGEPTRPADDRLSLSAVFGEDTSPVPPAVAGTDESEGEVTGEGFSFDSFFGGDRGDPGRRRPAARRARSDEDEADLDQFHAWLQGLKG